MKHISSADRVLIHLKKAIKKAKDVIVNQKEVDRLLTIINKGV